MSNIYEFRAYFCHASINVKSMEETIYTEMPITKHELFRVLRRSESQYIRDFRVEFIGKVTPCK